MSQAFNGTYFRYNNSYDDTTTEKFNSLNLWEQFSMISTESSGNNSGVGNVHFPFNGESDYDYTNTKKVYSYWRNWLNYPDLTGEKKLSNSDDFLKWEGNQKLKSDQNKDPDRLYMRFWLYLFPHIEGVTEDGHLNNWWKYFVSLDYADNVNCIFDTKQYDNIKNEFSDVLFNVNYSSETKKDISLNSDFASLVIENTEILKLNEQHNLEIMKAGSTYLSCYVDGKSAHYLVNIFGEKDDYTVVINSISEENISKEPTIWYDADDWAKEELLKAANQNLIPEILVNKNFKDSISREDFSAIVVKLYENLSKQKVNSTNINPFTDTNNEYVLKAYSLGITNGTSENTFSPKSNITREQMAVMLARTIEKAGINIDVDLSKVSKFSDDNYMHDWSRPSIYFMVNKGIIKGTGDNKYNVLGNAKIEEAIIVALRSANL